MAFVAPGLVAVAPKDRAAVRRGAWALGGLLIAVGLLQAAASVASQFT